MKINLIEFFRSSTKEINTVNRIATKIKSYPGYLIVPCIYGPDYNLTHNGCFMFRGTQKECLLKFTELAQNKDFV